MTRGIRTYIDYLKDNPHNYWFKRKLYGWGWTPATKEGWALLILWIVVVFWDFKRIDTPSHSVSDTLINFLPHVVVLTCIFIAICYKTGEKPRWQWGGFLK